MGARKTPGAHGGAKGLLPFLVLLVPLAWPTLQGTAGALLSVWSGSVLAGGGSLQPDERVADLLGNSALLAAAAALLATAAAANCVAVLLLPLAPRTRLLLTAGLAASFCFGTIVHLTIWRTLAPQAAGGIQGWLLAVLVLGTRYAPLATALLITGLVALDRGELEAALCSGGGAALWAVARRRLLRLAGMCVAAVAALVFGESELPPLAGVHVYAEEFLSQLALESDPRIATALGWPLMMVAGICAAVLAGMPRLRPAAAGAMVSGWLGRWTHAPVALARCLKPAALLLALLPLLLLAWGALRASGRWPAHALEALANSLWIAAASALVAMSWGWALAAAAARVGGAAAKATNLLAWLGMFWPPALIGLAAAALDIPEVLGQETLLLLAHTLRLLPFAVWVLLSFRDLLPDAPTEQLLVLGARGWGSWRHVSLPATRPGLAAAFFLCAGLSLAELTATVLTVPAGMETVILRLYNLLHYGDQRGVMVLALLQGLVVASLVTVAVWLLTRKSKRGGRIAGD